MEELDQSGINMSLGGSRYKESFWFENLKTEVKQKEEALKANFRDKTKFSYDYTCFCEHIRDKDGTSQGEKDLCQGYYDNLDLANYYDFIIPVIITGINMCMKWMIGELVEWITFESMT